MRLVGIVTVPSAIAFLAFGPLITRTLFFGISTADGNYLGYVLCAFALGLMPMSANLIALRGLNAYENVKSQVLSNLIMNLVGVLISVVIAFTVPNKWVTVGLAAALSISYYIGAFATIRLLKRYGIAIKIPEVVGFYIKLALIAGVIALPLFFIQSHFPGGNTLRLIEVLGISGLGYLVLAKFAKVEEVHNLLEVFLKKSSQKRKS
jgi:putative peptidoglycan lipid II flippase